MTYNFIDEDRRLDFVKTHWPNYNGVEVNQLHKLFYGDYMTSEDETITVLRKVRQSTQIGDKVLDNVKVIRSCKQCPVYDDLDEMRKDMEKLSDSVVGQHAYDPACENCTQDLLQGQS